MNDSLLSPWLVGFVKRRGIVAVVLGAILIAISAWLVMHSSPLALAWTLALAFLIAWLVYQLLDLAGRAIKLAESKAELERANATLNESVAALRTVRQDLTRQKMLAENLLTVARATGQRPVLEATLENTLTICVALTGATHGSLFLLDANGRVARQLPVKPDRGPGGKWSARTGQVMDEGLAGWVVRQRATARVADTVTDPRWIALPDDPAPFRSAMAVPLISRDMTVGVIMLMHPEPRRFSEEHERLLTEAADQVALALDNAQMFDQMTRLTDRLSLLYEVSQIATQLDLDSTLSRAVHAVRVSTQWPTVAAFLLDASQALAARAAVGDAAQEILARVPSDDDIVKSAGASLQTQRAAAPASEMAAPICIGQHLLGVLAAYSRQPGAFADEDLALLSAVADTLAMAAAYAELSQRRA
jgi:GAF domain-containing protein